MDSSEQSCPICLEPHGEQPYTTPCGHQFCKGCIATVAERNYKTMCCPMCRTPMIVDHGEVTTMDVLYNRLKAALKSDDSQRLMLTSELVTIVNFMLKGRDKSLLMRVLDDSSEPEFQLLYRAYQRGEHHFQRINDPMESFALAWLYYKYH
jgi:Ring finger domain